MRSTAPRPTPGGICTRTIALVMPWIVSEPPCVARCVLIRRSQRTSGPLGLKRKFGEAFRRTVTVPPSKGSPRGMRKRAPGAVSGGISRWKISAPFGFAGSFTRTSSTVPRMKSSSRTRASCAMLRSTFLGLGSRGFASPVSASKFQSYARRRAGSRRVSCAAFSACICASASGEPPFTSG